MSFFICTLAQSEENVQDSSANCHLAEAKKMITDVIPGEGVQAEKFLIQCVRTNPKYIEPILELAKLVEQQVSFGERPVFAIHKSIALVSQAYHLDPNNPKVRYVMAHLLGTIGQYEEAQNFYEKTMEEFPNSKETLIEKARLIGKQNPDEALRLITESVKLGTNSDDVIEVILNSIRFKNNTNSYSQDLSIAADQFKNRWLFHKLGLIYIEEKKYAQAAQAFHRAIELGNNIESKLQLAILQYQYLKNFKASILTFENLIQEMENKKYIPSSSHALVYSHYSLALYANNNIVGAAKAALQVVEKSFEKRDYIQSLVYEYKSRKALTVLQPALELVTLNDPTFDLAYTSLGEIYNQRKNYAKALEVLDKVIILKHKNYDN